MRSNFAYLQSTGGPSFSIDKFVSISQIVSTVMTKTTIPRKTTHINMVSLLQGSLVLRKWGELELI